MSRVTVDLTVNPLQWEYFMEVNKAIAGLTPYRKFYFGGAIRGGKTFIHLFILARLAARFPGSKSHIIRADFPSLQGTTIPSFQKMIAGSPNWKWNRDRGNFFAYHRNESRIYFKGENIRHDPDLDDFLGLETNFALMEQMEELNPRTPQILLSRLGSWYIDPMPPALLFGTVNPTQKWPKKEVYLKHINNELPSDVYYQQALPSDNAFVTQDQWSNWGTMDDRYQRQYIAGDWTNFDEKDNRFCYGYSEEKHVGICEINPKHEVIMSFDFNVDPITCLVSQIYNDTLFCLEQISLSNSNIFLLCEYINSKYPKRLFMVTGDASGANRSAMVKDNLNYYKIIRQELGISPLALKVPKSNPSLEENRILINAILHKFKVVIDKRNCMPLIRDMESVRVEPDGSIDKTDKSLTHALDCFRYTGNTFLSWVLTK